MRKGFKVMWFGFIFSENQLTHEMKRHAVIVAIHTKDSDVEIVLFLEVAKSFV